MSVGGGDKAHHGVRGFQTPGAGPLPRLRDVLQWQLKRERHAWPKVVPLPAREAFSAFPHNSQPGKLRATWINHSTYLLESGGLTLLTDPIFSACAGPGGHLGPRRVHEPGVALTALPPVDLVLLSHDHYDHCDLPSLSWLARRDQPVGVTLLGNGDLLKRAGFRHILELDWWETREVFGRLQITATPAQHWSKRVTSGRCRRLWGGFHVTGSLPAVHFVGDTGYHPTLFQEICQRLGPSDLALIPIGAYAPRWFMKTQHVDPQEAVRLHQELGARHSLAMHWGTFQLTDEPRLEPVMKLRAEVAAAGLSPEAFEALEPGESRVF